MNDVVCDECGIEIPLVDVGPRRALLAEGETMMPLRSLRVIDDPTNDASETPSPHER